jgi:hypothetical protein
VNKHTSALEEVQRRLKLVNKGLDHRLEQTKSELRQYNNDSREMTTMSREVDASREVRNFMALGSGLGDYSAVLLEQRLIRENGLGGAECLLRRSCSCWPQFRGAFQKSLLGSVRNHRYSLSKCFAGAFEEKCAVAEGHGGGRGEEKCGDYEAAAPCRKVLSPEHQIPAPAAIRIHAALS